MKLNNLGRISLIVVLLTLSVLEGFAQSGGYSNLEFVENKGQWDTVVRFRAEMSAGFFYMYRNGFTVVQHDTADLRRIHAILHGEPGAPSLSLAVAGMTGAGNAAGLNTTARAGDSKTAAVSSNGTPGKGGSAGGYGSKGGGANSADPMLLHGHSYRVSFVNANTGVEIVPDKPLQTYNNYFIGDRSHWVTNSKIYQGVYYKNIYPGIDLHYYTDAGFLKYDLIVHPGADPGQIALKYEGQDKLSIKKGQMLVQTSVGTVRELAPRSYQLNGEGRTDVPCNYTIGNGNIVRFNLKSYSPDATLVIDPTEIFCTFTGSKSDNWGYTATYDGAGNFYAGGIAIGYRDFSGALYGATPGAFQTTFQGGDGSEGDTGGSEGYDYDVAIMKFSSNGSNKLYATYLGGSGDEQPHSMICDPQGNLIVTGRTTSKTFPGFSGITYGSLGGFDIFISKIRADGSALIGSLLIGGSGDDGVNNSPKYVNAAGKGTQDLRLNYGDDGRGEVILDAAGNICVATCTQSSNFPTTPSAFQSNSGGGQDGVFIKTDPNITTVLASSYLGGSGADAAFVLAQDPLTNNIYIAGGTKSPSLQGTSAYPSVLHSGNQGGVDGFVTEINNAGTAIIATTYFGTATTDMIYGIEFDKLGFPYIMGTTYGTIPVVSSPFNATSPGTAQASGHQFITKLKPDLSGIVYSANFGPATTTSNWPNISPTAFLVDRCGNVYVSGWGGGIDPGDGYNNASTTGLTATTGAIKGSTDGDDFYFFVLQKNAASQLYGSFFGQPGGALGDHVDGGTSRFDKQGVIYQSICANCNGPNGIFPTTPGAWAKSNGAVSFGGCNEAAVKIAFNFAGVSAGLKLTLQGRGDSVGCFPLLVDMQDTVRNAKSYIWDFGDGARDTTTVYDLNHTYTSTGVFRVTLIAIDSNSCNVADTVYKTVTVKDNPAFPSFTITKLLPCTLFNYAFDNTSTHSMGSPAFTPTSFIWDFGDGGTKPPAPPGVSDHSYASPGPYNVSLILVDTNYCNYPDTVTIPLYVAQNVVAQFVTPSFGCAPYTAIISNTSIAGEKYYWDFGDGSPIDSVDISPVHLYANIGAYTITLVAVDSNTCNVTDQTSFDITVQSKPTASFAFTPFPPVVNTPTVFTNSSTGGIRYKWVFGDGDSTIRLTMDTVIHQYNRTDTFQACLMVFNQFGCTDTICHPVPALINPLLDVPNAFTPGRFGQNRIVKVVGFGITHLTFRIYNRWGKMVFQSNSQDIGWDGTFNGILQPMDVYAYTLEAEYFDGTHATKKGDITLIR